MSIPVWECIQCWQMTGHKTECHIQFILIHFDIHLLLNYLFPLFAGIFFLLTICKNPFISRSKNKRIVSFSFLNKNVNVLANVKNDLSHGTEWNERSSCRSHLIMLIAQRCSWTACFIFIEFFLAWTYSYTGQSDIWEAQNKGINCTFIWICRRGAWR